MNSAAAIQAIMSELDRCSSPSLTYHKPAHTRHVMSEAERIAKHMSVNPVDLELLLTAAAYHDCGYLYSTVHHEKTGIEKVRATLPAYGYTSIEIERIAQMISRTELPQSAETELERILCDADLSYLGGDDYAEIAMTFRQELESIGRTMTDIAWLELQINFLKTHHYWTDFAKQHYGPGKSKVLTALILEQGLKTN